MTESQLKKQVISYLKDKGVFWKISDRFQCGIPDILGLLKPSGKFVAIELKVHPNKVTELQGYILERIRVCGGIAGVAYSVEEVREIIDEKI